MMGNRLSDFEKFKLENKLKTKNELLKIGHQWLADSAFIRQSLELARNENLVLSAVNNALIDVLEKHGIDAVKEIPNEVLNSYIQTRCRVINSTIPSLTKEAMELNAFIASKDANTESARTKAYKTHENHPATLALKKVEIDYKVEQAKFSNRGHRADFVRRMADKYPVIQDIKTIENLVDKLKLKNPHISKL